MNTQFISIPFQPSLAETMTMLKIDPEMEDEFCDVYEECIAVARPKAVFCLTPGGNCMSWHSVRMIRWSAGGSIAFLSSQCVRWTRK